MSRKKKKKKDKKKEDKQKEPQEQTSEEKPSQKEDKQTQTNEQTSEEKPSQKETETTEKQPEQPTPTQEQTPTHEDKAAKIENEREYKEKLDHTILESLKSPSPLYWLALALSSLAFLGGLVIPLTLQSLIGIGLAHINNPVGWGVYITNFVFWVGIAHSGTLISAVLFLFRAKFRSSFNRSAEAMTVFAVLTAGLFPLIHLGRIWLFYWLFPYPNQRQLWVNFRSPLIWDVFAVNTYLTVSCIFFYVGLIPDLAMLREKTTGVRKWFYGILSLGWKGSKKQWVHYAQIYLFLAAFATPLVVSVHSVVSWDFAMGIVPGWHATIFAPYFVAGAIFSGCAMVLTLVIPMRKIYRLEKYITMDHFNSLVKLLIVTSLVVGYSYFIEFATAFYNGQTFEVAIFKYRPTGDYAVKFWLMVICNCLIPLTLFIRKLRFNLTYLFIVSIFINIGMWLERFNIIVTSLSHEFDPYGWGLYSPSIVEILITIGSFGFFFTLFLIFTKVLPVIAVTEVKEVALSHHDH